MEGQVFSIPLGVSKDRTASLVEDWASPPRVKAVSSTSNAGAPEVRGWNTLSHYVLEPGGCLYTLWLGVFLVAKSGLNHLSDTLL